MIKNDMNPFTNLLNNTQSESLSSAIISASTLANGSYNNKKDKSVMGSGFLFMEKWAMCGGGTF